MTISYTTLWDAIYTVFAADGTLVSLLGGSGRISRLFSEATPIKNTMLNGTNGLLTISDPESQREYLGADGVVILITAFASLAGPPVDIMDHVDTLMEGSNFSVAFMQEFNRISRDNIPFVQNNANIFAVRSMYGARSRRVD